jgi:hypothetical protein
MVTLLTAVGEIAAPGARTEGERLWLPEADLEAATGWSMRPEGLCRGSVCVPIPPGRRSEWSRAGHVDLAGLWRHQGKPILHSAAGDAWVLGESAGDRAMALQALEAPDFTLPDPTGRLHSLSDYRGKKVLLVSWASW